MKKLIAGLLLMVFTTLSAQNNKPVREAFGLKLAVEDNQYYGMDVEQSPYFVQPKVLQIYPGEKLYIEVEIKKDTIASMKVVANNLHPEKTIEVGFSQEFKDAKHSHMSLFTNNPFKKDINFNATMFPVKRNDWVNTSILPTQAGMFHFETWPDVIVSIVLHDWRIE